MLSLILTVLMRKYQFFDYVFICQVRDFIISKKRTFGSKINKINKKKYLDEIKKVCSLLYSIDETSKLSLITRFQ